MTAIALGCSHTAGVGVDPADCYVSVLAKMLDRDIKNLGVPAGNSDDVVSALVHQLKDSSLDFVVAQWPSPVRRAIWHNKKLYRETVSNPSLAFQELLRAGEENFYYQWTHNIIVANLLCSLAQVPCINIMIENVDAKYHDMLKKENIFLHVDRKTPTETWLMDSAASDNLHHSAQCHKQWATRLFGLVNEYTTR